MARPSVHPAEPHRPREWYPAWRHASARSRAVPAAANWLVLPLAPLIIGTIVLFALSASVFATLAVVGERLFGALS